MSSSVNGPARFRRLLAEHELLVIPGVYNALLARVMEGAGYSSVYMSGFAVAATMLGNPDLGVLGLSEMADQASRIVSAVSIPVLADADTGYGGIFSIRRTVEEYERAGLAGLHIEDQEVTRKRCGWFSDTDVVPAETMLEHLRAALRARRDHDFLIIARTDARRSLGFDEALRRARLYADEGADAVFVEYLTDISEVRRLVGAVRVPVVVVVVDGPGALSVGELRSAGVRIALFPLSVLSATVEAAEKTAATLTRPHPARPPVEETESPPNFLRHTRFEELAAWESLIRAQKQ